MEFISRKVFLTKNLVPYDSDNDGVMDSLVLSATTKTLQIPLKQSYDDIGIYEVSEEESFVIIDVGSIFDDNISGDDVTQPTPGVDPQTSTWEGGGEGGGATDPNRHEYCSDITATNGVTLSDLQADPSYPSGTLFVINNSLCTYVNTGTPDPIINEGGSNNVSNMYCILGPNTSTICNWTTSSWSNYYSTALSAADTYCRNRGYSSGTLDDSDFEIDGNTIPQGDYSTAYDANSNPNGTAFAEVSLKGTESRSCCTSRDSDGNCTNWVTKYRYNFCFYCKK